MNLLVRHLLVVIVVLGCELPTLRASNIDLEALQHDGYGMVPLKRPEPNILTVSAKIDGKKHDLILDTGWGEGGLSLREDLDVGARPDTKKREAFGYSVSGSHMLLIRRGVGQLVKMGGVELTKVPINYANFFLGAGASGVIGGDFLATCSAIVDLQNLKLYLRPPGKGHRVLLDPALRAAGLSEVALSVQKLHIFVDTEIDGVSGEMAVDTGSELTELDSSFAAKMKVAPSRSHNGFIDAAGKRSSSTFALVKSFKIGGVPVRAPIVRFQDFPFSKNSAGKILGLLGINILGSNGAIIDYGARKLYFYGSTPAAK